MVYVWSTEAIAPRLIHSGIERSFSGTVYIVCSNIGTSSVKLK